MSTATAPRLSSVKRRPRIHDVVIYARLSHNPDGSKDSVATQVADCQEHADDMGWNVVGVYSDDDRSAMKAGARPGYLEALERVSRGDVDGVLCYMTSRIWRERIERAQAIKALAPHALHVLSVQGQAFDLATAQGRSALASLGESDTVESEVKGERVARAARKRAVAGKAHGTVLFGWRRLVSVDAWGRRTAWVDAFDPKARAVIQDATRRVADGESLSSIVAAWNVQGVPRPRVALTIEPGQPWHQEGPRWTTGDLRALVLRPANVGRRVDKAGTDLAALVTFQADGVTPEEETLVDADTYAQAKAILCQPGRRVSLRAGARRNLLTYSSWATCGACGERLRRKAGRNLDYYVCTTSNACVARHLAATDLWTQTVAWAYMTDASNRDRLLTGGDATEAVQAMADQVATLEARARDLAGAFASGALPIGAFTAASTDLEAQRVAAQDALEAAVPTARRIPTRLLDMTLDQFLDMPLDVRRSALEALGTRVVLAKAQRGGVRLPGQPGGHFDEDSVLVTFGS